jgi:hypothetical protein
VKISQPLTATGATWVNSNRSNRGTSSSATTNSIPLNTSNTMTVWNHQSTSTRPSSMHNKTSNSNHYSTNQPNASSSYHYSYSNMNSTNNHNHYGHSNKQNTSSNKHYSTNYHQKGEYSTPSETIVHPPPTPIVPSQPGHRMPIPPSSSTSSSDSVSPTPSSSSLLVVSSATSTPTNPTTPGEYNPFASNILTTSIVGVLTKTKEPVASMDESNSSSTTKMNFANVAKMNVPSKSSHHEPIVITMDEQLSPPLPNPKIAPGYRGPSSAGTTPIQQQQQMIRTTNYDSLSPTSQLCRAPGANRHQQSVSPSMNKVLHDQNGQTGSSTTSSTSSSPSSIKQQNNQYIQPQQLFTSLEQQQQQQPFGPIGSHRTQIPTTADVTYNENPLQMRTKFNRTLSANSTPIYQQAPPPPPPPPSSMMLNNPAYANMSRSRSNLNPSAPEFQHGNRLPPPPFMPGPPPPSLPQASNSNGPLSANIMNIARMMEQKQQQLYTNNTNVPVHPSQPPPPPPSVVPPPARPIQQAEMEAMQQHVQNQVLHYWRLHANQQQLVPPPPQLPTTLQIANILASKGQLPQDPNQAAALVAAYYYTNFISRTQQQSQTPTNNIPLSSNVNKNVYETINTQSQTTSNSDDPSLTTGKQINEIQNKNIIFFLLF